jgi:hypothetical protein
LHLRLKSIALDKRLNAREFMDYLPVTSSRRVDPISAEIDHIARTIHSDLNMKPDHLDTAKLSRAEIHKSPERLLKTSRLYPHGEL